MNYAHYIFTGLLRVYSKACNGVSGNQLLSPIRLCISICFHFKRMKSLALVIKSAFAPLCLVFSQRERNRALVKGVNFLHSQGSGASKQWWRDTPKVEHFIQNQSFLPKLLGLVTECFMSTLLKGAVELLKS